MTKAIRRLRCIIRAVPLLLGAVLWLSLQPARASTWNSVTVDNSTNVTGKYCSIAVDPNGKLYIGYLDTNSVFPVLKYATNSGGNWTTESLQAYINDIYEANTSTVYTPGGPRIMAYAKNLATNTFKYQAVRKIINDGWQLQDIAGGKWPQEMPPEWGGWNQMPVNSIAAGTRTGSIQLQGFTYITFSDGDKLWYANEKDMFYFPFTGTGAVSQSDLGNDSSGNIHIVSYNPTAGTYPQGLLYAFNNTAPVSVPTATGVTRNPVIAVDPANTLHVTYIDAANNIQYLSKPAGGAWTSPVLVTSVGTYGGSLSLKADKAGGLHLAYYLAVDPPSDAGAKNYLFYANRSPAGSWSTPEQVTSAGQSNNYGQYNSMVVDDNNVVSIAFYDVKRSKLCVATKSTGAVNVTPAPVYFGNVQQGINGAKTLTVTVKNVGLGSLTLAASNAVALSNNASGEFSTLNNNCTNGRVLAAGGTCTVDVKLTASSPGTKTANLVVASNDPVTPSKSVELRGMSEINPISHTIHASAGTGGSISPSGDVTVAYGDNQTFTIAPSPGFLVGSVLVNGTNVGTLTSYTFIEVVADQTIAVTYSPVAPVAKWSITEVDNDIGAVTNTGKYCSIALDALGKAYVGYLDTTGAAPILKYATNDTGTWALENVSTIPDVTTAGTATVFSEGIGPRIMAYSYNITTGARKYGAARKWTETDNHWELQWIAGDFFPPEYGGGPQPSIFNTTTTTFTGATQYNGKTFISYTDGYNLWYANERDYYYYPFEQNPPGTWPTVPGPVPGAGNQSDLVLDPAGLIHIVYYTPGVDGTGYLRYGTGSGGMFGDPPNYTESTIRNEVVSDPSITIDSQEMLHVSYVQAGRVKYINKPKTGSWSDPYDLGPCGTSGAYTTIEANGLDIIHVAYYSKTGSFGSLMYAQRLPNGSWSIPVQVWAEGEASGSDIGQYAALMVDNHHNVNIAYYDATRTSLKVAKKQIPVIEVTPGAYTFTPGSSGSFTVKNAGTVSALSIGTAVLGGTDASHFTITANTCSGQNLAPNATCTITVAADSSLATGMTASLDIPSNDPYTPIKQVALMGPAVADNVKVGPAYYATLQAAYNGSVDGDTIMAKAMGFTETLYLNLLKTVVLAGGYDSSFSAQTGATILYGNLEVSFGGAEVQNLGLE